MSDGSSELQGLLDALREGLITSEQEARLDRILASDPESRSDYLHYIELCSALHYYHGTTATPTAAPTGSPLPPLGNEAPPTRASLSGGLGRRWRLRMGAHAMNWLAAAGVVAVLLLGGGLGVLSWMRKSRELADLPTRPHHTKSSKDLAFVIRLDRVRWQHPERTNPSEGAILRAGRLQLRSGRATLAFLSGALLTLEGPADLTLDSLDRVHCHLGNLRVRVPSGAQGFVVAAPGSAVVDLGTEFAFNVRDDRRARVKVIEGAAEAALLGAKGNPVRSHLVRENEVVELDPNTGRIAEAVADSNGFASAPELEAPDLVLDPAYAGAVRASRPWGYWRFESIDAEGGRIRNEIPGGAPLRVIGPIGVAGAVRGNGCAEFPPTQAEQLLTLDGLWSPAEDPGHAIELWFLSRGIGHSSLVSLYPPSQPGYFQHVLLAELTPGGPEARLNKPVSVRFLHRWPPGISGGDNLYSANYYMPYQWYHLVAQKNGGRMELFLNGVLSDSLPLEAAQATTPCHLAVGRMGPSPVREGGPSRDFVGRMDELALYDRPLSAQEVRSHFQLANGTGGP